MKIYKNNGEIYCIHHKEDDWIKGLNFITPNDLYIQAGTWWYDKGRILDKHIHNNFERAAMRTQECVYVVSGMMRVTLYDEERIKFDEFDIKKGDLAIFAFGGHGYEILEDNTKIIETKNGPFISVEKDKTKF